MATFILAGSLAADFFAEKYGGRLCDGKMPHSGKFVKRSTQLSRLSGLIQ
jgi:hypothetical protein